MLLVDRLAELVAVGVEVELADVRDGAHEGVGVAAEAGGAEGDVLADGIGEDHVTGAFPGEVDDGTLPREDAAGGEGDGGGETTVAIGFDGAVVGKELVGGFDPGGGGGAVFGASGLGLWLLGDGGRGGGGDDDAAASTTAAASTACGRSCGCGGVGEAPVAEAVDEAGVDGETFAVDDPPVFRGGEVGSDGFDEAVTDNDGAVFEVGTGDGDDAGVLEDPGAFCLSVEVRRGECEGHQKQHCRA